MDYKTSGVDIEAGYRSVELMKKYVNCLLYTSPSPRDRG